MKRFVTIIIALALCALPMSALAADLWEEGPSGETEVTAHVVPNAGDVTYAIIVPDVIDFGELKQPTDESGEYYLKTLFTVEAGQIENLGEDKKISVYVKDKNASMEGDAKFYITNKVDSNIKFSYEVFRNENCEYSDRVDDGNMPYAAGFYLTGFTSEGETLDGALRFDMGQLTEYSLAEIIGEYSGYMVWFTCVEDR